MYLLVYTNDLLKGNLSYWHKLIKYLKMNYLTQYWVETKCRPCRRIWVKFNPPDIVTGTINSLKKTLKNLNLCTLGPFVWQQVGLQYPKSILTFILCQWSVLKFQRIGQLGKKWLYEKHCLQTDQLHNMVTNVLWPYKNCSLASDYWLMPTQPFFTCIMAGTS